ncbi:MAG: hypothetical protein RSC62_09575 [Cetobacterium sp.]|uniref:hypothetical protein n=1 Tax=Cetobacterium sp. TaxID=2071632 RepID=UPI002FCC2DC7
MTDLYYFYKEKLIKANKLIKITGWCGILFPPLWLITIYYMMDRKRYENEISSLKENKESNYASFKLLELEIISLEKKYKNLDILKSIADKDLDLEKIKTITTEQLLSFLDNQISKYKEDGLTTEEIINKLLVKTHSIKSSVIIGEKKEFKNKTKVVLFICIGILLIPLLTSIDSKKSDLPKPVENKTFEKNIPVSLEKVQLNWRDNLDNKQFSINYKKDKNNIDTAILEKTSEGTHIKITNKNSKDIIIIRTMYKNAFKVPKENRAEIFKSNYKNKFKGYELYNIKADVHTYKNLKPTSVFIIDGLVYISYYNKDGKMENSYNLISETIAGTTPDGF